MHKQTPDFEIIEVIPTDKESPWTEIKIGRKDGKRGCYLKVGVSRNNTLICRMIGEVIDADREFDLVSFTMVESDNLTLEAA